MAWVNLTASTTTSNISWIRSGGYSGIVRSGTSVTGSIGVRYAQATTTYSTNGWMGWYSTTTGTSNGRWGKRGGTQSPGNQSYCYSHYQSATNPAAATFNMRQTESFPWALSTTQGATVTSFNVTVAAAGNLTTPSGGGSWTLAVPVGAAGAPTGTLSAASNSTTSITATGGLTSWGTNAAAGTRAYSYGTTTSYGTAFTSGTAITNLSAGTGYYFRHIVTNNASLTHTSTASQATWPNPPGTPVLTWNTNRLNPTSTLTATWSAPSGGVSSYRVRLYKNGSQVEMVDTGNTSVTRSWNLSSFSFAVGDTVQVGIYSNFVFPSGISNFNGGGLGEAQIYSSVHTIQSAWENASWTTFALTTVPTTAYVNMPMTYNINLGVNYGTSPTNNSLAYEAIKDSTVRTLVTTTGTSIASGNRTYTFIRGDIGSQTLRGVLRWQNESGVNQTTIHTSTRPLEVSWLEPTTSGATINSVATNYFRTSNISGTANLTLEANSSVSNSIRYVRTVDNVETQLGTSSISGTAFSFQHPGTTSGSYSVALRLYGGTASSDTLSLLSTPITVNYTMRPFVAPTATRSVDYNRNNIYAGQTLFPVTVNVTNVTRNQYDTLTPTMRTATMTNGAWAYDQTYPNNWAIGAYNLNIVKANTPYIVGNIANFSSELLYKDVNNDNAYGNVNSANYTVLAMPTISSADITSYITVDEVAQELNIDVNGLFGDTDFKVQYTLYLEDAAGTTTFMTTSGTLNTSDEQSFVHYYGGDSNLLYRARVVAKYVLSHETNVEGGQNTIYSNIADTSVPPRLFVKNGTTINSYDLSKDSLKPRLCIKNGTSIHYLPLIAGGNNLLNLTRTSFSFGGVTFTNNNNGTWTLNGTATSIIEVGLLAGDTNYVTIDPNQSYILSYQVLNGSITGVVDFHSQLFDINNTSTWGWLQANNVAKVSSVGGVLNNLIVFCHIGTIFNNYTVGIKVEKGIVSTPYTPYVDGHAFLVKSGNTIYQAHSGVIPPIAKPQFITESGDTWITEDGMNVILEDELEKLDVMYHGIVNNVIAGTSQTNTNVPIGDPHPKRKVLVFYNTLYASNATAATEMKIGGQDANILYNHVFSSYGNAVLTVGYAEIPNGDTTTVDIAWGTSTTRSSLAVYTLIGDVNIDECVFSMVELPGAGDTITANINALSGYIIAETSIRSSSIVRPVYDNIDIDGTGGTTNISLIMGHKAVDAGAFTTTVDNPSGSYRTFTVLMSIKANK